MLARNAFVLAGFGSDYSGAVVARRVPDRIAMCHNSALRPSPRTILLQPWTSIFKDRGFPSVRIPQIRIAQMCHTLQYVISVQRTRALRSAAGEPANRGYDHHKCPKPDYLWEMQKRRAGNPASERRIYIVSVQRR